MDFSEEVHIVGEVAMKSPFPAKHINDGMFIEDLVT
jgi:hypothetical protein